jgi:putative tributyrin esterase
VGGATIRITATRLGLGRRRCGLWLLGLTLALSTSCLAKDYQTVEFAPAHLGGMKVKFNVILPRDYATSNRRYPVLYLLHGYTDDYSAWVTKSHVTEHARPYAEIIVMPEGGTGWYVDNVRNPKLAWEGYLTLDLVPYVDSHYRTVRTRQGRSIAGLSMGGYGAMTLGLRHPRMFAAVASLSGALAGAQVDFYNSLTDPKLKQVIEDDFGPPGNPARVAEDPFELIKKMSADEMPDLYLAIGSSDFLLESNRAFVRLLSERKLRYRYCEVPGKHEWPVWDEQIQQVLALQAPVIGASVEPPPASRVPATKAEPNPKLEPKKAPTR